MSVQQNQQAQATQEELAEGRERKVERFTEMFAHALTQNAQFGRLFGITAGDAHEWKAAGERLRVAAEALANGYVK